MQLSVKCAETNFFPGCALSDTREESHDRRRFDPHYNCLTEILATVNRIRDEVNALHAIRDEVAGLQETLERHVEDEKAICKTAFPDGDPDGHRRAHEAAIRLAEERADFWQKMRIKAGEMTVWAFIACMGAVVAYYWNGHMPSSAQIQLPK